MKKLTCILGILSSMSFANPVEYVEKSESLTKAEFINTASMEDSLRSDNALKWMIGSTSYSMDELKTSSVFDHEKNDVLFMSGDKGNGGDLCELRIKEIALDIKSWILRGGANEVNLPDGISLEDYAEGMLGAIKSAHISCIDKSIYLGKSQKSCINFEDDFGASRIICNKKAIMEKDSDDQYIIIHHEYAGVAGIEAGSGESSNYEISKQVAEYLEEVIVKKLSIKKRSHEDLIGLTGVIQTGTKVYKIAGRCDIEEASSNSPWNYGNLFAKVRKVIECHGELYLMIWDGGLNNHRFTVLVKHEDLLFRNNTPYVDYLLQQDTPLFHLGADCNVTPAGKWNYPNSVGSSIHKVICNNEEYVTLWDRGLGVTKFIVVARKRDLLLY